MLPAVLGRMSVSAFQTAPGAQQLAQGLIRRGAPADLLASCPLTALAGRAPRLPGATLSLSHSAGRLWVSADRTDTGSINPLPLLECLHAAEHGAAAWLLTQVDSAFGLTFPFATPTWAWKMQNLLYSSSVLSRNRTYRERHGQQLSVRKTERLIHEQGYRTLYSVQQAYGRWLMPDRTCSQQRARAAVRAVAPGLLELLEEAGDLLAGTGLEADLPVPAFTLILGDETEEQGGFADELMIEAAQIWRYGASSFHAPLDSPAQMRRLYRCLAGHAELTWELGRLLGG